jgi:hypothetical protein
MALPFQRQGRSLGYRTYACLGSEDRRRVSGNEGAGEFYITLLWGLVEYLFNGRNNASEILSSQENLWVTLTRVVTQHPLDGKEAKNILLNRLV